MSNLDHGFTSHQIAIGNEQASLDEPVGNDAVVLRELPDAAAADAVGRALTGRYEAPEQLPGIARIASSSEA